MSMIPVSVVVPAHDRADRISACLESVARQSFGEFECLVMDDASTDDTVLIAEAFARGDQRFKVIRAEDGRRGAPARRNNAVRIAQGEHLVFLDSDDLLHPSCLSGRLAVMRAHPVCDFIVFHVECFFDVPEGKRLAWNIEKHVPDLIRFLRQDVPWCIVSPMWRREAALRFGGFDESLPSWQDWQLHLSALLAGARYHRHDGRSDAFVRLDGGDRIGRLAPHPNVELAKLRCVLRIGGDYADRLASDEALQGAYAGLVWDRVIAVQMAGRTGVAMSAWSQLLKRKQITSLIWRQGLLAIALHGRPGGGAAWRALRRWPGAIAEGVDRSTLKTIPVKTLEDA